MTGDTAHPARQGRALPALIVVQLVVVAVALGAMVYVAREIQPLLEQKERLEVEVQALQSEAKTQRAEIEKLELELEQARAQLAETFNMSRFEHPLDPVDIKTIASRHPRAGDALRLMDELRRNGVGWFLGGTKPDQGFDSPGFAAFVLAELGESSVAVQPGDDLIATSRRLFERLPPVDRPGVGDLAFYPAGYVLFHYVDEAGEPFVIGMTPAGITALEPDFVKPIGFRRSGLAD